MKHPIPALLVATVAAAGLSAIAAVGAPETSAKPRTVNCLASGQAIDDSYNMHIRAKAAGDVKAAKEWYRQYQRAQAFYDRNCLT